MIRAVVLCLLVAPAKAACTDDETLHLACDIGERRLEVCVGPEHARYRFGPESAPEMEVMQPVTAVHLRPWPGIGRTIWEEVVFVIQGHVYVVWGAIDRTSGATGEVTVVHRGGVVVTQDTVEVARHDCDEGSVDFPWSTTLDDAKRAAGQCHDMHADAWVACD